jgi:DNA helicase HerA-like ATPase
LVLRDEGKDKHLLINRIRSEAEEIVKGFSIVLGLKPEILRKKELKKIVEAKLFLAPPKEGVIGGEAELASSIPIPSYEPHTLDPSGVFLGYKRKTRIPFFYNLMKYGIRHILVVGPTGKGKTTLLATIANRLYARNQADMLLLDPKGDLSQLLGKGFKKLRFYPDTSIDFLSDTFYRRLGSIIDYPGVGELVAGELRHFKTLGELEKKLGVKLFFVGNPRSSDQVVLPRLLEYDRHIIVLDNLTDNGRFLATAMILHLVLESMYSLQPSKYLKKMLIIDESWRSSESSLYYTMRLVKEARGFGVGLLFSTQSLKDVPLEVLHNFGTTVAFGSPERGYIEDVSRATGFS